MVDVDSFLNIDIETVEDSKVFAALQEQFRGLEEDIKVLAPTTEKLLEAGRAFLRTDQEDFVSSVRDSLKEIEDQWSSICTRAARQLHNLSVTAAVHRDRTSGRFGSEVEELFRIRAALPDVSRVDTLDSLQLAQASVQVRGHFLCSLRKSQT